MAAPWYSTHLRRVFFDMHLPDWTRPGQSGGQIAELRDVATRFDPQQIIAEFVRARINAAVVYAKCQYGNFYYNTRLGHKHSGLGNLDFLGEMTAEAHKHGIKVIGYYSNMWDTEVAREHPDWMKRDARGSISYTRWPALCLNGPYRDLVKQHLAEMFTNYDLDGVWMDILSDLPCFCPRCELLYQAEFREPMPRMRESSGWLQMVRWQQDYLRDYLAEMRQIVKSIKPDSAFAINFYGTTYVPPSQGLSFKHLALSDYGSSEGYSEWHGLLFPGYVTRYMQTGKLGASVEVLTGRFENTWDFTVRPLAQMRFEAFSVAANGGAVCIDDEPYSDGTTEPVVYDQIADVFGEIERRESYLLGAEAAPYAALYHSQPARELDEILNPLRSDTRKFSFLIDGNPAVSDLVPSLLGVFKALLEEHLPVQFVDDRPDSLKTLPRYPVVVLPNVLPLSDAEADCLRAYVHDGGGLVATGATSLYSVDGKRRDNFLLADLFGVDVIERGGYSFPYFQFHDSPLSGGLTGRPIPHNMPMWRVRLNADDVQVAATRRDPLIETSAEVYFHNNKPAPYKDTGEPVVVYRHVGKGRVVYCAGLPENNFTLLGHPPYRQMLANMIRWAANADPLVSVEGLRNTELVVNRLGAALVVHLITGLPQRTIYFGSRRTSETIEEIVMLPNVRVYIPTHITSVRRVQPDETLPIEHANGKAWVTLPLMGDWETLYLT